MDKDLTTTSERGITDRIRFEIANIRINEFIYPQKIAVKIKTDPYSAVTSLLKLSVEQKLIMVTVPKIRGELREDLFISGPADIEEFIEMNRQCKEYDFLSIAEIKTIIAFVRL